MSSWRDDYTRSRDVGNIPYDLEDVIGRRDSVDKVQVTNMTVSGTTERLPNDPLARRNYIYVYNKGSVDVTIVTSSGADPSDGMIISADGGYWEEHTDAKLYIVSTGAASEVRVYERAKK